jgi:hypothetical protein
MVLFYKTLGSNDDIRSISKAIVGIWSTVAPCLDVLDQYYLFK